MGNNISALNDILLDIKKKKKPTIIFVIDGSSSVNVEQFQVTRELLNSAAEKIRIGDHGNGTLVKASVIQFATTIKEEVPLTIDSLLFQKKVLSMLQIGGGTQSHLAIKRASEIFATSGESDGKYMFFFTDGHSDNKLETIAAVVDLKDQKNTLSICVGIGSVDNAEISAIASNGYAIKVQKFNELAQAIRRIGAISKVPQIAIVKRNYNKITLSVVYGESFEKFQAEYMIVEGNNSWIVSSESITDCLTLYNLPSRTKIKIRVRAVSTNFKSDWSNELLAETREKDERLDDFANVSMTPDLVIQQILALKPSHSQIPKYNILIMGQIGTGKSSIIKTLQAAAGVPTTAFADYSEHHVTTTLEDHYLTQFIQLFDIFGWTQFNIDKYALMLKAILDGVAEPGLDMAIDTSELYKQYKNTPLHPSKKIHAVAIVLDITTATMPEKIVQMKIAQKILSDAKLVPLFIINKVDLRDGSIKNEKDQLVGLLDSDTVTSNLEMLSDAAKIDKNNLLPTVCYTCDVRKKDPYRSRLALLILETLHSRAESYTFNLMKEYERTKVKHATDPLVSNPGSSSPSIRSFQVKGHNFKFKFAVPETEELLNKTLEDKIKQKLGLASVFIREIDDDADYAVDYAVIVSSESDKKMFTVVLEHQSIYVKVTHNGIQLPFPKRTSLQLFLKDCREAFHCPTIDTIEDEDGCEICDDETLAESNSVHFICK